MIERKRLHLLRAILVLALAASLCPLLPAAPARAAGTWYVNGTLGTNDGTHGTGPGAAAFKTIQYAVSDARVVNGDTVNIAAGTYLEQVEITKSLTLVGAGDGRSDPSVVTAIAHPASTVGYTTHGSLWIRYVIAIHDCQDVKLSNMAVLNKASNLIGFRANVVFDNVTGTASGLDNCLLSAWNSGPDLPDDCVYISGSSTNVTVSNSGLFYYKYAGVEIADGLDTVNISGNSISSSTGWFGVMNQSLASGSGSISGNQIMASDSGIASNDPFTWSITGNRVSNCASVGLKLMSPISALNQNLIYNCATGIELSGTPLSAAHCNAIMGNASNGMILYVNGGDCTNNYWGANSGPNVDGGGPGTGDRITRQGNSITYNPWLVMTLAGASASIAADGTSTTTITLDCTLNSAGNPAGCSVPDGLVVNFTTDLGTLTSATGTTSGGKATTTLRSGTVPGTATLTAAFAQAAAFTLTTGQVTFNPCITASAGAGGTIAPSGTVAVTSGNSQAFTIAASEGYGIAAVMVDGVPVGAVSIYTFPNVTANHTISASFSPLTATITASAGSGGSITPSGQVLANWGASQSFTITPNGGSRISDVLVDGISRGVLSTYTFSNVTTNHTISASFASTAVGPGSHGAGGFASSPTVQNAVPLPIVNVSAARLSADNAPAGSPVTITADVTNTGMAAGSAIVKVYLNGELAGSRGVAVEAGRTTPVTFTVTPSGTGDYNVTVNNVQAGRLKVNGISDSDLVFIISLAAFALLIAALSAYYLRQRRAA